MSRSRSDTESAGALGLRGLRRCALLRSTLVRNGSLAFVLATGAVSLSNFVFHAVISRLIGPSNYGALGSILNLLLVLSVPMGAIQVAVTQSAVDWTERGVLASGIRRTMLRTAIMGTVATAAFDGAAPWIAQYLHLAHVANLYIVSAWILPSLLGAVLQGALMGQHRFARVALANVLGGGVARIASGVFLVLVGFGLEGAVAASVMAQLVLVMILVYPFFKTFLGSSKGTGEDVAMGVRNAVRTVIALTGFWILISMDTVMARHYLPARSAGLYASAATTGRIAMFLPGAISLIVLPRFASGKGLGQEARDALRWSVPATVGISAVAALAIALFPSFLARVLFGGEFVGAAPAIRILGLEAGALGLIGILVYYLLARQSKLALLPWVGSAVAAALISAFHGSMASIAAVMLMSASVVAIVMLSASVSYLIAHPLPTYSKGIHTLRRVGQVSPEIVEISVVIPFYNPGSALVQHIYELARTLEGAGVTFELIAVSDGSTDGSLEELLDQAKMIRSLRVIQLRENCGKGQALREGLSCGRGAYVGFIDADGDIPAGEMERMVDVIRLDAPAVVLGSKRHPESKVVYPPIRRAYSWGYQQVLRALFDLDVRDTQTGVKLVRRDVLSETLPLMVEKRFAFDVELLVVAQRLGFSEFVEIPVTIQRRMSSTISAKAVWRIVIDTVAIFYRLRIVHFYDRTKEVEPIQFVVPEE